MSATQELIPEVCLWKLLDGDLEEVEKVKIHWAAKGWCLLDLRTEAEGEGEREREGEGDEDGKLGKEQTKILRQQTAAASRIAADLFSTGIISENEFRTIWTSDKSSLLGLVSAPHKVSLRLLTGEENLQTIESRASKSKSKEKLEAFFQLCRIYDEVSFQLADKFALPIFGCSYEELAKELDLPVGPERYGMVDFAHYFNDQKVYPRAPFLTERGLNCIDHYDPGLFTLAGLSTAKGLQLYEPDTESWRDMPVTVVGEEPTVAVLWTGGAATQRTATLKNGIHRVVYHEGEPRLAIWQEICTTHQIHSMSALRRIEGASRVAPVFLNSIGEAGLLISTRSQMGSDPLPEGPVFVDHTLSKVVTVQKKPGESIVTTIEESLGMSMSKIIRPPNLGIRFESQFGFSLADASVSSPPDPQFVEETPETPIQPPEPHKCLLQ